MSIHEEESSGVRPFDQTYYDRLISNDIDLDEELMQAFNASFESFSIEKKSRENELKYTKQIEKILLETEMRKEEEKKRQKEEDEKKSIYRENLTKNLLRYLYYSKIDNNILIDIQNSIKKYCNLEDYYIRLKNESYQELERFLNSKQHRINIDEIHLIKNNMEEIIDNNDEDDRNEMSYEEDDYEEYIYDSE
jgi:hypothetical protein